MELVKNNRIDEIVLSRLLEKKNELMKLNLDTLLRLPPLVVANEVIEGKSLEFITYREELSDDKLLIVVQCKNTRFWRYGHIFAEGFTVDKFGETQDANEKHMWAYL
jgi:hypothetical protein